MSPVRSLALALALCSAGCGPTIHVETALSTSAHFDRYRSFAFEPSTNAPGDFKPSPQSEYVRGRIEQMADAVLESKGYVPAAGNPPDLTIRVSVGRRKRELRVPDPDAPRFDRRNQTREEDIFEGAFAIDAFDTPTGEPVWHGSAVVRVESSGVDEDRLRLAVTRVLASLPPR